MPGEKGIFDHNRSIGVNFKKYRRAKTQSAVESNNIFTLNGSEILITEGERFHQSIETFEAFVMNICMKEVFSNLCERTTIIRRLSGNPTSILPVCAKQRRKAANYDNTVYLFSQQIIQYLMRYTADETGRWQGRFLSVCLPFFQR